jgi:hypothetical protein
MSDSRVPSAAVNSAPIDDGLLPAATIDRIFSRLQLVYAASFTRMYLGLEIPAVKHDWRRRLGWIQTWRSIAWALENLPADRPPNALQFSELCKQAPAAPVVPVTELPGPPADLDRVRVPLSLKVARPSPEQWRSRLIDQYAAGDPMSPHNRELARHFMRMAEWRRSAAEQPAMPEEVRGNCK